MNRNEISKLLIDWGRHRLGAQFAKDAGRASHGCWTIDECDVQIAALLRLRQSLGAENNT